MYIPYLTEWVAFAINQGGTAERVRSGLRPCWDARFFCVLKLEEIARTMKQLIRDRRIRTPEGLYRGRWRGTRPCSPFD